MNLRIPKVLPHIRQQNLHLLLLPLQCLRQQPEGERLEAFFDLDEVPAP